MNLTEPDGLVYVETGLHAIIFLPLIGTDLQAKHIMASTVCQTFYRRLK